MPSRNEHLELAAKFQAFLEGLSTEQLEEWLEMATAAAYWCALNQIDAVFALPEVNKHPGSDGERTREMNRSGGFQNLVPHFRLLKDRYNEAIYRGQTGTVNDFRYEIVDSLNEIIGKTNRMLARKSPLIQIKV